MKDEGKLENRFKEEREYNKYSPLDKNYISAIEIEEIIDKLFSFDTYKERLVYLKRWRKNRTQSYVLLKYPSDWKNKDTALQWVELEIKYIEEVVSMGIEKVDKESEINECNNSPFSKIKWTGTGPEFCYIFTELVKRKYIEPPNIYRNKNKSELARLLYQYFDTGQTEKYLVDQFQSHLSLSLSKRKKWQIPESGELVIPDIEKPNL